MKMVVWIRELTYMWVQDAETEAFVQKREFHWIDTRERARKFWSA